MIDNFRMRWLPAGVGLIMTATIAAAADAQAPSAPTAENAPCFNVVPAQADVQPAILVDRCSGRSWQLVPRHRASRHRAVYVWRPIIRGEGQPARSARPASIAAPVSGGTGNAKCFMFTGRTFCE
jgi:hypothetical protein